MLTVYGSAFSSYDGLCDGLCRVVAENWQGPDRRGALVNGEGCEPAVGGFGGVEKGVVRVGKAIGGDKITEFFF